MFGVRGTGISVGGGEDRIIHTVLMSRVTYSGRGGARMVAGHKGLSTEAGIADNNVETKKCSLQVCFG